MNLKRLIASFLIVCITGVGLPLHANAGIVTTQEASVSQTAERERVMNFFEREDVRKALESQGVDPKAAVDRVQSMSDDEVTQLAGRVDEAPAGGNVIGVLFTIFIILLITDILGLTKIFPFTRSVR